MGLRLLLHRGQGVLGCPPLPALGNILRGGVRVRLADDLGFRGATLLDELLQLSL
jgi:hypothetical protein